MIVLETKMDVVISSRPTCKAKVDANKIALTKTIESTKAAHHRIDEVYKNSWVHFCRHWADPTGYSICCTKF
jgi:hypothetical protein